MDKPERTTDVVLGRTTDIHHCHYRTSHPTHSNFRSALGMTSFMTMYGYLSNFKNVHIHGLGERFIRMTFACLHKPLRLALKDVTKHAEH